MIDIGKEIETIKKSFFNSTIAKIKSLALKGDWKEAYEHIQRADLHRIIKSKLFDEVIKLERMDGCPEDQLEENPYNRG